MKVRRLSGGDDGGCSDDSCPNVYETEQGSILVQGVVVPADASGIRLAGNEALVEIPRAMFMSAAQRAKE